MSRTILEIRTAKDSQETPEATVQLLSSLTNTLSTSFWERLQKKQPTLTLEIASLNQRVFFIVTCEESLEPLIRSQIAAQYPTAVITKMQDYLSSWGTHATQAVAQMRLTAPHYFPLKNYSKFTDTDPIVGILGVLGKIPVGTAAIMQILLTAAPGSWTSAGKSVIKKGVSTDPEVFKAHPQQMLIEEKLSTKAFHADIRLLGVGVDAAQAQLLVSQMSSALGTYSLSEGNSLSPTRPSDKWSFIKSMINRSPHFLPKNQYLNVVELASLYHYPGETLSGLRNIAWGKTIKGEAPDNLPVDEGLTQEERNNITFFGKTEYKNQMMTFGIKLTDRRRHFYVLGKSGTGKSTLLGNMAIADMYNNRGFAIVDPHGDLIEETLLDNIPDFRIKDVVYLDPSDTVHPFHLNPLETRVEEYKDLVVSNIMSIFTKIWANVWSARMEHILRNTLATLVEVPGTTMLDIPTILTDDKFRARILAQVDPDINRVIHDFWNSEFNQYNDRFKNEAIAPILNKVGQFIGSPTIRQILRSPKSTINIEELMNSKKIILINLSQGRIGEENAALLGAMLITQFQLAAMNRIHTPEDQRKDFFLYVDEFQNFATESFIKILAEARKYRLGLILANQYTAQLPEEIQQAIFGNIGTITTFVMGADDANRIMQEFGNLYTQEDLVNLGRWQIITKLSIEDRISNPFPAYSLSPDPSTKTNNRQLAIESSWSQHSVTPEYTRQITRSFDLPYVPGQPPTSSSPSSSTGGSKQKHEPKNLDLSVLELNKIYSGTVKNLKDYGAFVEIMPGYEGLVHISNMSKTRLKTASDLLKVGDQVKVKLYEIDDKGRLNLTMILDEKSNPPKRDQTPDPLSSDRPATDQTEVVDRTVDESTNNTESEPEEPKEPLDTHTSAA